MKRRDLIKITSALTATSLLMRPSTSFAKKILENLVWNSKVKSKSPQTSRNYVQINLYGGPSRWGFDSLLKPYDDSLFIPNKLLGNKISQHSSDRLNLNFEYATTKFFGLNAPQTWSQMLTIHGGKKIKMGELWQNAVIIRGCRNNFDGHPVNGIKQVAPIPGGLSLHGAIADNSPYLFSSISLGKNPVSRAFKANKSSLIEIPVGEKNYLDYLFKPFLLADTKRFFDSTELENELNEMSQNYSAEELDLVQLQKAALKNIKSNLDQYVAEYSAYVFKYTEILKFAHQESTSLPKIAAPRLPLTVDGEKTIEDVIGNFSMLKMFFAEENLVDFIKTGQIVHWAQEFALTEFLLKNNMCSSILLTPEVFGNFFQYCKSDNVYSFENIDCHYDSLKKQTHLSLKKDVKPSKNEFLFFPMDSHQTGMAYNSLTTAHFFKCLSTCLLELTSALKAVKTKNGNLYENTVIQVASEFDRAPNLNGYGSQHFSFANPTSIFSGAIKETTLIGNIYAGAKEGQADVGNFYGTLGEGAPVIELNSAISNSHVASTVAKLVGVDPIVKRAPSLVEFKNGKFVSVVEAAKNIEGFDLE